MNKEIFQVANGSKNGKCESSSGKILETVGSSCFPSKVLTSTESCLHRSRVRFLQNAHRRMKDSRLPELAESL